MRSVADALKLIVETVLPLDSTRVPLESALGMTLSEEIVSEIDSPPFDKSAMDGYAVRSVDVASPGTKLTVLEEILAGAIPQRPIAHGEASRIMTGAPLPQGADAVVRLEDTQFSEPTVLIQVGSIPPGLNVIHRATCLARGTRVFSRGDHIQPAHIAALAELGCSTVSVASRPSVAIVATGNELVPVHENPGPGEIRNSNGVMLAAQIRALGGNPVPLGIARDDRESLREKIRVGLEHEILILSGGVSAGQLDLVPGVLRELQCAEIFHKVDMKPGKPVWFGVQTTKSHRCYIFGLPGNPVSSMVCAELFVRTALKKLANRPNPYPISQKATLGQSIRIKGDRPTYYPSKIEFLGSGLTAQPVPWQGSSDIQATIHANGMILFPAEGHYEQGTLVETIKWASVDS